MSQHIKKLLVISIFLFLFCLLSSCQNNHTRIVTECGGGAKFACPKNMFCDFDSNCGGFDAVGECRIIPSDCPEQNEVSAKVCSCSGKTFSSSCYAYASGEPVAYSGSCIKNN